MKDKTQLSTIVRVSTPARLHLGFLDLNGSTSRKFGSIGLAINTHRTTVEIRYATSTSITNSASTANDVDHKVEGIIAKFYSSLGQNIPPQQQDVALSLIELIPEHAGLGSGTQLAIAIGTALCQLHNIPAKTVEIAALLGRGSRSGIGIATFDHGGFIVDGGLNETASIPPVLARHDFPQHWRVVMIMDHGQQGVHGPQEIAAFNQLPTFPLHSAHEICHLTLMQLLPALIEQDINSFGQAITDIQKLIGDHFSPMQGGRYTNQQIGTLLNHATTLGHTGIAQSSWGPTGCVFVDSEESAEQLINSLNHYTESEFNSPSNLSFSIAQASSNGANIEINTL